MSSLWPCPPQLSHQREAAASAALAEAEALAGRCDELAGANMALTQRLADSRSELEMCSYYKKVRVLRTTCDSA